MHVDALTAQRLVSQQSQRQDTFTNVNFALQAAMSQTLFNEEQIGDEAAKLIRAKAKELLLTHFNSLEVTE